ncbi:hypothetical protein MNEG_2611 [Monoraphidium neglectum]|uniref:RAP domain-containing protein n=1 Tax=Monoraphidium neglectum TaxID=145388 RepID=A0A0D2LFC3_9CHLO|nr:hypothetical protein MNEG_2611 [Monoraphidium neglectum]KIZ05349.1 hypothetical protein MNEG_2611 [Monoraphidium neglectum]|eukprot:XP_013904368.1 hypothetical protein MNEG_2611 [Monoraphidium neglectum]
MAASDQQAAVLAAALAQMMAVVQAQPVQHFWALTISASLQQLVDLEQQHGGIFNAIHIATAFTRSAHLIRDQGLPSRCFHPLMQRLWVRLQPQLGYCKTRELSNIVWACGKAAFAEAPLLDACLDQLASAAAETNAQGLANALYAASVLSPHGYSIDKQQAQQLVGALVQQRQAATPQAMSNTLWAAATMGLTLPDQQAQQLVEALVQQQQNLANTLWAAATMGLTLPDQQAQQLVATLVQQRQAATPQNLSNTLWAAATMGLTLPDQQAQQLVAALVQQRQAASPQAVSNTLWAAATMGLTLLDPQAQQLVAALVQQRQAATPQNLANTLWAAATMGLTLPDQQAQQLVAALVQQRQAATPQNLSNTL